jgi:hypothetical protein
MTKAKRRRRPGIRKPPIRSLVTYSFDAPENGDSIDESPIERLIEQAQQRNIVRNYDTGRGRSIWFQGAPGRELRKLRRLVLSMLPAEWQTS